MQILNKLKKFFAISETDNFSRDAALLENAVSNGTGKCPQLDLRQRENDIYGETRLQQQKLYEKWVVKKKWLLKTEALPLLFGLDPEGSLENHDYDEKISDLWGHARQCVDQGLLPVINKHMEPADWQVAPQDIYQWAAVSRIDIPGPLSALMEFILATVKQSNNAVPDNNTDLNTQSVSGFDNDKERILGTALAILASCPEQCRNKNGRVQANKIVRIISENEEFWFGDQIPNLSGTAMVDLINQWLER